MSRPLVGRDAECAALRHRLTAAAGPVVLVAGEAGAGKTTLVEHVLADAGVPALRGRAAQWPGPAYNVLAQVLQAVPVATVQADREILAQIRPDLAQAPAQTTTAALAGAVQRVLAEAAGGRPLAVFLDDLQWADEASLGLLPALAGAVSGLAVSLVGCYRSDELPRGHGLRTVRAMLRRNHQLSHVELGPLGDDDVRRMLTGLLGAPVRPALAAVVASRADGLPFAVEELAFALRDGGRLDYRDGMVALAGAGAAPVPDGVREAVLLRVARLAGAERALLEAAAVAGEEFDVDTVLAASGLPGWPDGFTGSGLLTEASEGRVAFRHALARDAAYADIPWSRRRRLHRTLAGRLAGEGAAPALVAAHLLAARDFGPAREALVAAAGQHWAVHAYADAARALRTVLEHWPGDGEDGEDGGARLAVIDRLARCAERCSQYADAVALLRELADGYEDRGDRGALAGTHRRLALVHELRGQWEPALAARETAATGFAAAGLPAEAAIDRLAVANHLRAAASYSAALATLTAARADAVAGGQEELRLRAEGLRGNVLSRLGRAAEGIAAVRAALDTALGQELPDTAAELQQRLADAIEHSGDYRAAAAAYAAAFQYCDAHGAQATGELCRACATAVLFTSGEWDRVLSVCQEVLAGTSAALHTQAVAACMSGLVHTLRGAHKLARPRLLEANLIGTRIELVPVELASAWGLAMLDEAAGAQDEAVDRIRRLLARRERTQERHYSVQILQWAATFFTGCGLPSDAQACAAALAETAEATAQPEAVAALAHARGETLLAAEPAAALRELRVAADMLGQACVPLGAALTQRRAAEAALRIGDRPGARELLHAAHDTSARLGAARLRDDCAAALTKLGDRPHQARTRARARASTAGLSGRELDVMRLVATGDTTRQIGGTLFISPRTVEMHVRSSLLKLGCRTRAEAVRRLGELDALPPATPGPA
jgi:DNA-binding CsgD family transcriptional regulator/tetratricopeptide (TPR) repeat protein